MAFRKPHIAIIGAGIDWRRKWRPDRPSSSPASSAVRRPCLCRSSASRKRLTCASHKIWCRRIRDLQNKLRTIRTTHALLNADNKRAYDTWWRGGVVACRLQTIFSCPMLVIPGRQTPRYPFGPHGKERGDQTLTRSRTTGVIPIRPLSPSAGWYPPMVNHFAARTGESHKTSVIALGGTAGGVNHTIRPTRLDRDRVNLTLSRSNGRRPARWPAAAATIPVSMARARRAGKSFAVPPAELRSYQPWRVRKTRDCR